MKLTILSVMLIVSCALADNEHEAHGAHSHKKEGRPGHVDAEGEHNAHFDHKAILGSNELEEEFDQMEPELAKEKLALMFKPRDTNGDGFLDKNELTAWVFSSFTKLDEEDAMEEFKKQDTNSDGKLTWEEYTVEAYGYKPDDMEDMEDFTQVIKEDHIKFKTADTNKDDSLDAEEYKAFTHPHNHPHMHAIELERVLQEYDNNSDGVVSREEFVDKDAGGHDREHEIASEERFDDYDKNNDGILDKEEMLEWAVPSNQQAAVDEAEHLIQEADADGDGKLTQEEVVDKHDVFVGSQATDYGNFLRDEL